jgi:hypothetical protein
MLCPKCGAENRTESNFCRYCSNPLTKQTGSTSGYVPSVPPPGTAYGNAPNSQPFQPPPPLPMRQAAGTLCCPRCASTNVIKGGIPLWATLVAVIGFFFICFLSLLFLLVKEPHRCLNCGLEFK